MGSPFHPNLSSAHVLLMCEPSLGARGGVSDTSTVVRERLVCLLSAVCQRNEPEASPRADIQIEASGGMYRVDPSILHASSIHNRPLGQQYNCPRGVICATFETAQTGICQQQCF